MDIPSNSSRATQKPPSSPPPPPRPTHQDDADEEDESVKQLKECSALYLSLQVLFLPLPSLIFFFSCFDIDITTFRTWFKEMPMFPVLNCWCSELAWSNKNEDICVVIRVGHLASPFYQDLKGARIINNLEFEAWVFKTLTLILWQFY
jgi:hypothetical protein